MLRARKGARLTAITCGGAIPDNADYQVILEPAGIFVGTLNEDFAIESLAGDIFQLGNTSYRILRVEAGRVRVEDAKGQPPSIPFWLGEAPARTDELSASVSRLRADIEALLPEVTAETIARAIDIVAERYHLPRPAAQQLVEYLGGAKAVLGKLPTRDTLVFERFFDESGGQQLVIHAPFGARINRAFGLSLRKKFCRTFNFELQAAATEDAIVLSLGETHSFELASVARFLSSKTVEDTLIQAMLDSPMFTARWRWNASISLAIRRSSGGKRTPPQIQRMAAEDLIAVVFPDQIACAENLSGPREIPDHPLVKQTLDDCLHEAMDVEGLKAMLRGLEDGDIQVVARDLPTPSPLAAEILGARPYAFLDDAPLEERRTNAVSQRRWLDPETAADMGKLDPAAIAQVREEAWPEATNPDELHDALNSLGADHRAGRRELGLGHASRAAHRRAPRHAPALLTDGRDRSTGCAPNACRMIQAIYPEGHARSRDRGAGGDPRSATVDARGGDHRARARAPAGPGAGHGARPRRVARRRSLLHRRRAGRTRRRGLRAARAVHRRGERARSRGRRATPRSNGANAGCWRASIDTPSRRCAPRSSRCRARTSCASCSNGRA